MKSGIGRLITLEGIDGSGKSTALPHIASRLGEELPDRRLVLSAEPTKGPVGRIIRSNLSGTPTSGSPHEQPACIQKACYRQAQAAARMNELFLFFADHAQHLASTIIPALEDGAIILCDRYADSTAAYQGVTLREVLPDPVAWIQSILLPWNRPPDMTLLFLIDPRAAMQRMQSRSGREKFERLEFLQSVDENFRRMAAAEPKRFVLIDAEKEERRVAQDAVEAILRRLSL